MAKKPTTPVMKSEPTNQTLSKYDLEGKQVDVMHAIARAFAVARDEMTHLLGEGVPFELYLDWQPRQWSDEEELVIYVRRPETEAEEVKRKTAEKEQKDRQKEFDLRILADLTKKYGSSHR